MMIFNNGSVEVFEHGGDAETVKPWAIGEFLDDDVLFVCSFTFLLALAKEFVFDRV